MVNISLSSWFSLAVLTLVYVVGELSHFLLSIVTRPMSQDIHYGKQECLSHPNASLIMEESIIKCYDVSSEESCSGISVFNNTFSPACVWDYSGLGIEYQILAGPAFVAVFTICGILIGILSDTFSRKWVVTVCLAVLVIATTLTGSASAYWQLVILRMLIGGGESGFSPACTSMISDMFPPARRGVALGIFNWGIYFGYGLSYAIGNFVTAANINNTGWRSSFYYSGALGVVAFLLLLLLVREPTRMTEKIETYDNTGTEEIPDSLSDVKMAHIKPSMESILPEDKSKSSEILKTILSPLFLMLMIAACVRHIAGFAWAYNTQSYFSTYYPKVNLGLWITACSIIGGTLGVALGGFVSDRWVVKLGIKGRLYVLAASQLIATPFATGVLSFSPPMAFYSLMGSYLFAEMWFGVLYAVLLEIIPAKVQSTTIAIFLFAMNNIGGNAPILVEPIRAASSYRAALYMMYPGNYLLSAVLFFLTSFFV